MSLPGFTAEKSLYVTHGRYQGLGSPMTQSPLNPTAVTPAHHIGEPTCYMNGFETDCEHVSHCLQEGTCEQVYFPIVVTTPVTVSPRYGVFR
jgi:hypothetical protein